MASTKIFIVFCVSIILAITASGSARSKVKNPSPIAALNKEEIEKIKNKLYNGYAECKEELDLPGDTFSQFRTEITNNNVDSHKVGCALTCMGEKAKYISNNRIEVTSLKTDVDLILHNDHELITEFKTAIYSCAEKSNTQHIDEKCNLVKGLFGCVMNDFKNGTISRLVMSLTSAKRQDLLRKFTDI